jgi:hypothetical protein
MGERLVIRRRRQPCPHGEKFICSVCGPMGSVMVEDVPTWEDDPELRALVLSKAERSDER